MQKLHNHYFYWGVILFVIFVIFTFFVHKDIFNQLDFNATVKLQDKFPRFFDIELSAFSLLGSAEIASMFLLILLAIYRKLNIIFVLVIYVIIHVIELLGKFFVTHIGPPFLFFRYDIPFSFPTSYVKPGFSYPSGHSIRTAFITILLLSFIANSKLSDTTKKVLYFIIIVFDLIMFFSRIYLGEHWTTDVVGGIILGVCAALLAIWLSSSFSFKKLKK